MHSTTKRLPAMPARPRWLLFTFSLPLFALSSFAQRPALVLAHGRELSLADGRGKVLKHFKAPVAFQDATVSPDGTRVVLVGNPKNPWGGPLYLFSFATGRARRLTRGQYWGKPEKGQTEVYLDPAFSPDGKRIVFGIHDYTPDSGAENVINAGNDMVLDAGPLAIMDLSTGRVRIVSSTLDIDGTVDWLSSPLWSPDGRDILFESVPDVGITTPTRHTVRDLASELTAGLRQPDDSGTYLLGWVGKSCFAYTFFSGETGKPLAAPGAYVLSLETGRHRPLADLLHLDKTAIYGVEALQISGQFVLIMKHSRFYLYSLESGKLLYSTPQGTKAELIPAKPPGLTCF